MSTIKIRTQPVESATEIRVLITHPMENGRNRDPVSGELIPAHYILELIIYLNDSQIAKVNMQGGISKNPYFSFRLKHLSSGDKITARWTDNLLSSDHGEYIVE